MKLASCLVAITFLSLPVSRGLASEAALDCRSAVETFSAGIEAGAGDTLVLFLDALRTNPGCRRNLLIAAIDKSRRDPAMVEKLIFIARQEFPTEATLLAEAALYAAPEHRDLVRAAFFADEATMEAVLAGPEEPELVELPREAQQLDENIREAIARMTAKVEGKLWPEQKLSGKPLTFRHPDAVKVKEAGPFVDEASLLNGLPIDVEDERRATAKNLRINDHWEPSDRIHLDESKFRQPLEARKREIAPAGAIGIPKRPMLKRSGVYYIPPAKGDYRSTFGDDGSGPRPSLVIRAAPETETLVR